MPRSLAKPCSPYGPWVHPYLLYQVKGDLGAEAMPHASELL